MWKSRNIDNIETIFSISETNLPVAIVPQSNRIDTWKIHLAIWKHQRLYYTTYRYEIVSYTKSYEYKVEKESGEEILHIANFFLREFIFLKKLIILKNLLFQCPLQCLYCENWKMYILVRMNTLCIK